VDSATDIYYCLSRGTFGNCWQRAGTEGKKQQQNKELKFNAGA